MAKNPKPQGKPAMEILQVRLHSYQGAIRLIPLSQHPAYKRQGYCKPADPADEKLVLLASRLKAPYRQVVEAVLERYDGAPAPLAPLIAELCPQKHGEAIFQYIREEFSSWCKEAGMKTHYRPAYAEGKIQVWEVQPSLRAI